MSPATLPEGDWIRGISIRQPYAACILAGATTVENRPTRWRTGWVLLHTSKTIDQRALRIPLIGRTIRGRQLVTGAVVGIARITDCHKDPEGALLCSEWAHPGAWHLVLADVQELPLPVPARGQVVPWKPTQDLLGVRVPAAARLQAVKGRPSKKESSFEPGLIPAPAASWNGAMLGTSTAGRTCPACCAGGLPRCARIPQSPCTRRAPRAG